MWIYTEYRQIFAHFLLLFFLSTSRPCYRWQILDLGNSKQILNNYINWGKFFFKNYVLPNSRRVETVCKCRWAKKNQEAKILLFSVNLTVKVLVLKLNPKSNTYFLIWHRFPLIYWIFFYYLTETKFREAYATLPASASGPS